MLAVVTEDVDGYAELEAVDPEGKLLHVRDDVGAEDVPYVMEGVGAVDYTANHLKGVKDCGIGWVAPLRERSFPLED